MYNKFLNETFSKENFSIINPLNGFDHIVLRYCFFLNVRMFTLFFFFSFNSTIFQAEKKKQMNSHFSVDPIKI